jgi:MYXO-CTERM domain-containing protein
MVQLSALLAFAVLPVLLAWLPPSREQHDCDSPLASDDRCGCSSTGHMHSGGMAVGALGLGDSRGSRNIRRSCRWRSHCGMGERRRWRLESCEQEKRC